MNKEEQKKTLAQRIVKFIEDNKTLSVVSVIVFIWMLCTIAFPFIMNRVFHDKDIRTNGPVGDFIGGTTAPWISMLCAFLTFVAFYVQYRANQLQKQELAKQQADSDKERVEARFFELLRLHKENVAAMSTWSRGGRVNGKACFPELLKEFANIYRVVFHYWNEEGKTKLPGHPAKLAFWILFFGISEEGQLFYRNRYLGYENRGRVRQIIKAFEVWSGGKSAEDWHIYEKELNLDIKVYRRFEGHSSQLGTYLRHLFQTAHYITTSKHDISVEDRYELMKILRAQLSVEEQMLLYYNAYAMYDKEWYQIFTKYRLIKNIHLPNIIPNFPSPKTVYAEDMIKLHLSTGRKLFEHQGNIIMEEMAWRVKNPVLAKKLEDDYRESIRKKNVSLLRV
ncbi:putative phage abortive infection protein [Filimonas lacunae]|nr:putative phage abortive infection protein [Filimonas lacunae]